MTHENSKPVFDFSISVSFLLYLVILSFCLSIIVFSNLFFTSAFPSLCICLSVRPTTTSASFYIKFQVLCISHSQFAFSKPVSSVFRSIFYCRRSTYLVVNKPRGVICNTFISFFHCLNAKCQKEVNNSTHSHLASKFMLR